MTIKPPASEGPPYPLTPEERMELERRNFHNYQQQQEQQQASSVSSQSTSFNVHGLNQALDQQEVLDDPERSLTHRSSTELRSFEKGGFPESLQVGAGSKSAGIERPKPPESDPSSPTLVMSANLTGATRSVSDFSPFYSPPNPLESTQNPARDLNPGSRPAITQRDSETSQQSAQSDVSHTSSLFEPGGDMSSYDASYSRALPGHRNQPPVGMAGWQESAMEESPAKTWEEDLERRARAGAELQKKAEEAQHKEKEHTLQQEFWDQEQQGWSEQASMATPATPKVIPPIPPQMTGASDLPAPGSLPETNPWSDQSQVSKPVPPSQPKEGELVAPDTRSTPQAPAPASAPPPPVPSRGRTPIDPQTEIYQIKHINIISPITQQLHRIPILLQNANGPCPLMALVNAIILLTPPSLTAAPSALFENLAPREQVSLQLLIQAVFEELMSRPHDQPLPDVGDLHSFLLTLHTGMNINPRFNTAPNIPGGFEDTKELSLYSSFNVPLVHGWLPVPNSAGHKALERSAKTYDETQNLLFAEEEMIARLTTQDSVPSAAEETLIRDAAHVREYIETTATQLTSHGIYTLRTYLPEHSVAILFRNDHFSTIIRRGRDIYSLVTDLGFATHEEVVWERIADVGGSGNSFFSGDFLPVGGPSQQHGEQAQSLLDIDDRRGPDPPPRTSSQQQQIQVPEHPDEDFDLALAISLQEEENQRGGVVVVGGGASGPAPPLPPRISTALAMTRGDDDPPPYEPTPTTPQAQQQPQPQSPRQQQQGFGRGGRRASAGSSTGAWIEAQQRNSRVGSGIHRRGTSGGEAVGVGTGAANGRSGGKEDKCTVM